MRERNEPVRRRGEEDADRSSEKEEGIVFRSGLEGRSEGWLSLYKPRQWAVPKHDFNYPPVYSSSCHFRTFSPSPAPSIETAVPPVTVTSPDPRPPNQSPVRNRHYFPLPPCLVHGRGKLHWRTAQCGQGQVKGHHGSSPTRPFQQTTAGNPHRRTSVEETGSSIPLSFSTFCCRR